MDKRSPFGLKPGQLNRLLAIAREGDEREASEAVAVSDKAADSLPGWIGRYKVVRVLGEGGMGIVYLARQEHPIERTVAVKVIKPGMDSQQVIARFEAERQALALLDHPNIAHVLDAGTTEQGRPYFVMECVEGVSITEYCDQHKLTIRERLSLFLRVCEAIQHAHQKGIIHRDIKPSNILISVEDGKAVPKVIDFGVAKALAQPLSERTFYTTDGQLVGTPAYMSPEQAGLSSLDVDTRSDVYSLGVLLYELLTGTTPFSEKNLRQAGYLEMQRIIQEEQPTKPSAKLSMLGDSSTSAAEHRRATPDTLKRLIRGDLDWIVMKALEKGRLRRYETADGFAMDIRRYLRHEPVLARGPSTTYRLRKLLRRHRSQTITVLAILVAMASAAVILSMWNRDRLQFAEAQALRHKNILSQAREAFAKNDLVGAFKDVRSILDSPHVGPEARLLYAGILAEGSQPEEAVSTLENLLNEEGEIAGAAHALLAQVYWESELNETERLQRVTKHRQQAEELLPETAEAYLLRAMTAHTIREKLDLLDKALRLDPGHYESFRMRAFTHHASRKYDRMRDDALAMVILRPHEPLGHSLRAMAWHELGRFSEAVAAYDRALALTPTQDPQYVKLNARHCEALMRMGQYKRVVVDAQNCLENAPNATDLQSQVFCALTALGRYEEARALVQSLSELHNGSDDRVWLWSMKHVFDTLAAGGQWHPPDSEPEGPAFFYMLEAEEMYHGLCTKARRLITNCFSPCWSPDGTKVAYAQGLPGYSGVAVYDLKSQETNLLIVPGKDPRWSPDGRHIAFVRDAPVLRLSELSTDRARERTESYRRGEEIWVMKADGSVPRRLARQAHCPSWSADAKRIYYQDPFDRTLYSISVEDLQAQPSPVCTDTSEFPAVSPQGNYVANVDGGAGTAAVLRIVDVATRSCANEWLTPLESPTAFWSPDERELTMGGLNGIRARTGLWIYDLTRREGVKVLSGHISGASWSQDRTQLLIHVGKPYWEAWVADLDPNLSTVESLRPVQTLEEHCLDSIEICTRDLEADPDSFVDQLTRTTSALWIRHPQGLVYLQELDLRLGRPPFRPSARNRGAARAILTHPALCERLGDLAWVLARRAVEQQPTHAEELVPPFERIGQHERAARLQQIAQADTLRGSCRREEGSDTHIVVGYGRDIGGPTDEFHFVYKKLEGDGSIAARIDSIEEVDPRAKAGVMVRVSLDPGAAFAAALATPGSGVGHHVRPTANANATGDGHVATTEQAALRVPVWVKMERKNDQFSAFYSSDGATWTSMAGSPQRVSMPNGVYIGLAVTSHDSQRTVEARISHVTTTGDISWASHFRQSQDVRLQLAPPRR
jgi:serine/threonine protein kinase/Tfp pilus assembly protein PilF